MFTNSLYSSSFIATDITTDLQASAIIIFWVTILNLLNIDHT